MILYCDQLPDQYLYAELRRDMALDTQAFHRFLRWMFCISLSGGLILYALGAWPVIGFLGLDVLLIWGAFKLYARAHDRQFERIILDKNHLSIEQHFGRRCKSVSYEPSFLNIRADTENNSGFVHICQRGRCVEVGRWLGAQERAAFAGMLKEALKARQLAMASA